MKGVAHSDKHTCCIFNSGEFYHLFANCFGFIDHKYWLVNSYYLSTFLGYAAVFSETSLKKKNTARYLLSTKQQTEKVRGAGEHSGKFGS